MPPYKNGIMKLCTQKNCGQIWGLLSRSKCPVSAGTHSAKMSPVPHLAKHSQIRGAHVTFLQTVRQQTLDTCSCSEALDFWTQSSLSLSSPLSDECQTGAAYSSMLRTCFSYRSRRSSILAPRLFSLLRNHNFLLHLSTILSVLEHQERSLLSTSPRSLTSSTCSISWPSNSKLGRKSLDTQGLKRKHLSLFII